LPKSSQQTEEKDSQKREQERKDIEKEEGTNSLEKSGLRL
jgi:hypothetical protein